jgi:hypothetical protein
LFELFRFVAAGVGWFLARDNVKGWFARIKARS